ncbi:Rhomboid-related protein 4 [Chionoecetes opilio]|uniref:Rhomboid-related protein 4 n=1 Tax=Chionoecetes opilio TaxID=41210 RepID=A0A8J5CKB3_CHIOP|nr:Rhomboid-related protein 4 [Chionoecetes opilio]
MSRNRHDRGGGFFLLLLLGRLQDHGLRDMGYVTLATIAGQILLFMGIINPPWSAGDVCLSGEAILRYKDYSRLFLSAVEHVDEIHLYHNMVSFLLKGKTLERKYGSVKFFILLVLFTLATSLTYAGLALAASRHYDDYSYMKQCAIGFSSVIFALKVLTTYYERSPYSSVFGVAIPSKYAVWAELVIIHILVPNASFIGHLAGILVGLAYIYGPLSDVVDAISGTLTSRGPSYGRRSYTYSHGTARVSAEIHPIPSPLPPDSQHSLFLSFSIFLHSPPFFPSL